MQAPLLPRQSDKLVNTTAAVVVHHMKIPYSTDTGIGLAQRFHCLLPLRCAFIVGLLNVRGPSWGFFRNAPSMGGSLSWVRPS